VLTAFARAFRTPDLRKKLLFTLAIIVVYRIGTHIPIPGVDYSAVSDLGDDAFCRWLTSEIGVAAIPLSAFYADGFDQKIARFCFAKKDETLDLALSRLRTL